MSPTIRVFLVDDHPVVLAGLRHLLAATPDIEVVGEATDGRRALQAAEAEDWGVDVLVLDIALPRVNGIEVLGRLHRQRPELPILMMSMHAEDQYARHLSGLGAAGYVSKDRSEEELITAIRAVAQGRCYFSRDAGGLSISGLGNGAEPGPVAPHERFTARQLQVFMLVVAGQSVSDIAAELALGMSTVSTHLGQVKEKLGARSVAEVVHYAHRMGIA